MLNTTRTSLPQGGARLRAGNPDTRGIVDVILGANRVSLLNGTRATQAGTVSNGVGAPGRARVITTGSANNADIYAGAWSRIGAPLTLITVYRLTSAPAGSLRVAGNWNGSTGAQNGYEFAPSATNFRAFVSRTGTNTILTGAAVSTSLKIDALVVDPTNATYIENGRITAGPTAHGGVTAAAGDFRIGSDNQATTSATPQEHYCSILYNRALSQAEATRITRSIGNIAALFEDDGVDLWLMLYAAAAGGTTVAPSKGALTFTGYVPTVTRTDNQTVAPAKGALTFTGKVPTVTRTDNQTVAPAKGALTFTGYVPTVTQDSGTVIAPSKGALTFTGKVPTITQTANQIIVPSKGALTFTGKIPTVTQTGAVTYTRAPRGSGYPGTPPTTTRPGQTNTARPKMANTRR